MRNDIQLQPKAAGSPEPRQLSGRHVLMMLLAFFGVIFAMNGFMMFSALSTYTGVVSVEPYRKGLAYNQRIADGERQDALGWHDHASLERSGLVAVQMAASDGTPLVGLQLTAVLGRPATARGDMPLTFTEAAPGDYRAVVGPLAAGTWMITLEAYRDADHTAPYRAKRRLWLKS